MNQRWIRPIVLPVLLAAVGAIATVVADRPVIDASAGDRLAAILADGSAGLQTKGRYKKQGDNCVWDVNDSGPNQCTPQVEGRFKKEGDNCVWAPSDRGPDQCTPKKGRFKKEGDKCVWNGDDSGPNQCNPRQPR
jgi:hypothetical protein